MITHRGQRCEYVCSGMVGETNERSPALLFAIRSYLGSPTAQFFVGTELVRSEEVNGKEQVALLLDAPGDNIPVYVFVRFASISPYEALGFQ